MAEYEDNLAEIQMAATPEFYVFSYGDTTERYTSFSRSLTFLGYSFTPASIARGNIKHDPNFGPASLVITAPITPALAKYIPNQPIEPVRITIYRSHIDYLAQYEIFFKGQIKYVQMKNKLVSAMCESKNKYMSSKIPKVIYQSFCNHDIYDSGCALNEYDYKRTALITGITNSQYSFSLNDGGGAVATGYFDGGEMRYSEDARFITDHGSGYVDLHVPFDSKVAIGTEVELYPGCDGDPDTCLNTYNNLLNFLGMPYIPSRNPVIWGFK